MQRFKHLAQAFFRQINQNFIFIILTGFVIFGNLIYFSDRYLPAHDSAYFFQQFYAFYNEFFFSGKLAQWLPFDVFGMSAGYYQLTTLTPASYVVMAIGRPLHVTDVLLLFKVSILLEQLILLTGMYLLCRMIFKSRSCIFMVCLGAVAGTNWFVQLPFDLRIFYLLPLTVYFLLRFLAEKETELLLWTALLLAAGLVGNALNFMGLWVFILAIILVVAILFDRNLLRIAVKFTFKTVLLSLLLLILVGSLAYQLRETLAFADMLRWPSGPANTLSRFLNDGEFSMTFTNFFRLFLFPQNTPQAYIGLLPLFFFVWALFCSRKKMFFVFLVPTLALLWLSFGGGFAALCYFFPGMAYYRGLAHVYGLLKIFLLIGAGFGLESFLVTPGKTKGLLFGMIPLIFVFLLDGTGFSRAGLNTFWEKTHPFVGFVQTLLVEGTFLKWGFYLFGFLVVGMAGIRRLRANGNFDEQKFNTFALCILLLAFCVDIFSYELFLKKHVETLKVEPTLVRALYTLKVHKMEFQEKRLEGPRTKRQVDALALLSRKTPGVIYSSAYSFLQFDSCSYSAVKLLFPWRLEKLLEADLSGAGCNRPKLRLVSQGFFVNNFTDGIAVMKNFKVNRDLVVLRRQKGQDDLARRASQKIFKVSGAINVKDFSSNELSLDAEVAGQGGWLIYEDSYHKNWHAFVNGQETPIYEANLAYKAVHLEPGINSVRFVFQNPVTDFSSAFIALFGLGSGLMLIMLFVNVLATDFCLQAKPLLLESER